MSGLMSFYLLANSWEEELVKVLVKFGDDNLIVSVIKCCGGF